MEIPIFQRYLLNFRCAGCGNNLFHGFLSIGIRFVLIKCTLTVDEVVQLNSQAQLQSEGQICSLN